MLGEGGRAAPRFAPHAFPVSLDGALYTLNRDIPTHIVNALTGYVFFLLCSVQIGYGHSYMSMLKFTR